MRFYSISRLEALKLPVETFWMMHKNIDRMNAEMDYRQAMVACSVTTSEGVEALFDNLKEQMGTIAVFDEDAVVRETVMKVDLDRDGLDSLRGEGGAFG